MASAQPVSSEIPLNRIDLPPDARVHEPADIESLAADMRLNEQLQEIVVTPTGNKRYVVVAGVGRTLAARKLKWKTIRALVREGLTAFDRFHITFSENEERDNVSPLYQAYLLGQMREQGKLTQEALAKRLGKTRASIGQYLALLSLSPEIRANANRFASLGLAHFLQIIRIESQSAQDRLLRIAVTESLSVPELRRRVDRLLKTPAKGKGKKSLPAWRVTDEPELGDSLGRVTAQLSFDPKKRKPGEVVEDLRQLLELYLRTHSLLLGTDAAIDQAFGPGASKEVKLDGWATKDDAPSAESDIPKTAAKPLLPAMDMDGIKKLIALNSSPEAVAHVLQGLIDPSNAADVQRMQADLTKAWAPASPENWNALEAEAKKSPEALAAKIFGAQSLFAERCRGLTWATLGSPDPLAVARELLNNI